ncbi:hypothetical protein BH24ACT15_BH24ACT15_34780 [soil metagenome]
MTHAQWAIAAWTASDGGRDRLPPQTGVGEPVCT